MIPKNIGKSIWNGFPACFTLLRKVDGKFEAANVQFAVAAESHLLKQPSFRGGFFDAMQRQEKRIAEGKLYRGQVKSGFGGLTLIGYGFLGYDKTQNAILFEVSSRATAWRKKVGQSGLQAATCRTQRCNRCSSAVNKRGRCNFAPENQRAGMTQIKLIN